MKPARTLVALGLGTLATLAAVSTPALAQEADSARATTSRHCVVDADNGTKSCFSTYRESVAFATGGRVTDAPNDTRAAVRDTKFQERLSGPRNEHGAKLAMNASSVLGTMYGDKDFGGGSMAFVGSSGCTRYSEFENLYDWNDRISSVASGQCNITLYQHSNYLGFSQTYSGAVPYVGDAMNDQASSISFNG
ncbi:peptidase inhibitor family I36 protein [Streptomyces sp. NPDC053079]|uniref:peptidase inhibitor family I36 protein n=1 Tax=Streptomyces sp. NPDC053079 TaxID=3365697 RepID=UPI0037D24FE9